MSAVLSPNAANAATKRRARLSAKAKQFAHAYGDGASATYLNGTRSALSAGYSRRSASQISWRLLHNEDIKALISEVQTKTAPRLTGPNEVNRDRMTAEHLRMASVCEVRGDMSNATRNLEAVDDLHGLRKQVTEVEIAVVAFDAVLAAEIEEMGMRALERAGCRECGLPVIEGGAEVLALPAPAEPLTGHLVKQDSPEPHQDATSVTPDAQEPPQSVSPDTSSTDPTRQDALQDAPTASLDPSVEGDEASGKSEAPGDFRQTPLPPSGPGV